MRLNPKYHFIGCAILASAIGTGCTETVSKDELTQLCLRHEIETINSLNYMGTKDGNHYLHHQYTLGSSTYRIAANQFPVDREFPLTNDESKWIKLTIMAGLPMKIEPQAECTSAGQSTSLTLQSTPSAKSPSHNQSLE